MPNALKITLSVAATLLGASSSWAIPFTGPTSPYYLDNFGNDTIYVVQGTNVINSFAWAYDPGCTNFCEGSLAVTNVVSTNWFGSSNGGSATAGQYTLSGTPTGTSWSGTLPPAGETSNLFYDGTSDGTHNYTVEYSNYPPETENVIATDLDWQNPVTLFTIPGVTSAAYLGITYDPNNNSLWVSGWQTDVIADYSLTGTLLSSFATGTDLMAALAFDPADGTLWFSYAGTNELSQYSTSGTFLQGGEPSGLSGGGDYFGGEFAEVASLPEPATLLLLASGLFGLGLMRRRKAA